MKAFACLLLATLTFCGCKKQAPAKVSTTATAGRPATAAAPTLLTEAERLGLTARVPGDVEFCLSTVNLRQHLDALQASQWWRQLKAYAEDKLPAGKAEGLRVDETFLAFGPGSGKSLAVLRQLNDLYNETAYRGLVGNTMLGTSFDLSKMMQAALTDPQVLESLILLLERFEMPPVMLGMATADPEKLLKSISDTLRLSSWLGDAPQSRIVTTQKELLTVNEIALGELLTPEQRKTWLDGLAQQLPTLTPEVRDRIARGLDVLAGKRFVLALGLSKEKGRAYVALAPKADQVRLASAPGDSLLARKELRFAEALATQKGLGLIACWDGPFLDVLQSEQPFHPLARGLLAGLAAEPVFAEAARRLTPLVEELGVAERSFYHTQYTSGAAVVWWEGGLRMMWEGGLSAPSIPPLAEASRFTPLLEDESVVFGISGQGSGQGLGRAYFEAWAKALHGAVVELVAAGVGGEQTAQALQLAETAVLPQVVAAYDGTKTLWQKGLGNDGALILDVGGKMPPLPGLPPGGENVPLPRLLLAQELKDRAVVAASWAKTETALQELLRSIPMPQPLELPAVTTRQSEGVTTHSYPLSVESADLTPSASLSQDILLLGTSRAQQQHTMATLAKNTPLAAGSRVKFNATKLREFLSALAKARVEDSATLRQAVRWLEPLEQMDLWLWADQGTARGRLVWAMHDVLSYD